MKASIGKVVAEHPTQVGEIRGVGPVMTALVLGEVGDVQRFPSKARRRAAHPQPDLRNALPSALSVEVNRLEPLMIRRSRPAGVRG